MVKVTDTRPRHQQVAADLRAKIMDGRVSGQLPSVSQLRADYGDAANATIQRALDTLRSEELIYSRHGQGSFVREKPPAIVRAAPYIPPDGRTQYGPVTVERVVPPPDVARVLSEDARAEVVVRRRVMLFDHEPIEVSWSYHPLSAALAAGLDSPKRLRGGAATRLADAGLPQRAMTDHITSRPPTTEELEALRLPLGVSVLRTFRVITTDDGSVVEVTVMIKGVHLAELEYKQPII